MAFFTALPQATYLKLSHRNTLWLNDRDLTAEQRRMLVAMEFETGRDQYGRTVTLFGDGTVKY